MDSSNTEIIACHGWAMTSSFWNPLIEYFDEDYRFKKSDRGYFSDPNSPEFSEKNGKLKVLLTHSLGLHWCSDDLVNSADHLVIMGGFLNYQPFENSKQNRSKLMLREMLSQFVEAPKKVLEEFYRKASQPAGSYPKVPESLNHELLLEDLNLFLEDQFPRQRFFDVPQITILHGTDDHVVSRHQAREMYHELRYYSQYFELKQSGHLFPFTNPGACYEIIKSVLSSRTEVDV